MSAKEQLEAWLMAEPTVKAVCAYGSRRSDLDYMVFTENEIAPGRRFAEAIWEGSKYSHLIIVGEEFFDISITLLPLEDSRFVKVSDMLRNSTPPPVWLKDELRLEELTAAHWREHERKRMSDEQILAMARSVYINKKFINRKISTGLLYARYLTAHCFEGHLFALAREVDLRRGGKGLWKGRDAETTWNKEELLMLTVNYPLDAEGLAESLSYLKIQTLYWLNRLNVPPPAYLCKPW